MIKLDLEPLLNQIRIDHRRAFVAGVNAALSITRNHLKHDVTVYTGILDAATTFQFKNYHALMADPRFGRMSSTGDSFFVDPYYGVRSVLDQLEAVRQKILTPEELCQTTT